jgi:hypothetical protein
VVTLKRLSNQKQRSRERLAIFQAFDATHLAP